MNKCCWCLIVSGKVQGVGFRGFIYDFVHNYNLLEGINNPICGYVKNLNSGEVEIIAHGSYEGLEKLHEAALLGPRLSKVDEVKVIKDYAIENKFIEFEIMPSEP